MLLRRRHAPFHGPRSMAAALALSLSAAWSRPGPWPPRRPATRATTVRPTVHYEEARAHAGDRIAFKPGGRVSVPFRPRPGDPWKVDGARPRALPAGSRSGRALRDAPNGPSIAVPAPPRPDLPIVDPAAVIAADTASWTSDDGPAPIELAAAVDPGALRREVFGFLPYWELSDSSTTLDWEKLSTVAYFGVGADGKGNLIKKTKSGATTVGWSGWTSSKMTSVINAAHASHARVVLTVQSFAWSSTGLARQKATARERGRPGQPRRPDRRGRPGARRRRRQPRLRADRLGLRRRVHEARPEGAGRPERGPQGLPAHVRHDGLDRQLPDRGRDRQGWRRRGRRHGLRLPLVVVEPGRLDRADRRTDVRHPGHAARLRRARPRLQGHPRRALLRPGLVDLLEQAATRRTSRGRRTGRRSR